MDNRNPKNSEAPDERSIGADSDPGPLMPNQWPPQNPNTPDGVIATYGWVAMITLLIAFFIGVGWGRSLERNEITLSCRHQQAFKAYDSWYSCDKVLK